MILCNPGYYGFSGIIFVYRQIVSAVGYRSEVYKFIGLGTQAARVKSVAGFNVLKLIGMHR